MGSFFERTVFLKRFFLQYPKLHIWLLTDTALTASFFLLCRQRGVMEAVSAVMAALRRWLMPVTYRTALSVAELLVVLLVIFATGYLAWAAVFVIRGVGRRLQRLYGAALGAVCVGLTVYAAFCWMWGYTFYIDGFQEKSGIYARPVSVEELRQVTEYFAARVADTADGVTRDADGIFAEDRESILRRSDRTYDRLEEQFPLLAFDDRPPKAVHFSRILSRLNFTGIFCPYTAEANVNMDCPTVFLATTAAHELAHQRGFSSEQECNFLGILAAVTADDPVANYSGWLLGYVYLGNALYDADREAWQAVYSALPEQARADLAVNNRYWAQFDGSAVKKVSNTLYDGLLKSYGEELGIRSYGTVVDLLVEYYKNLI